MNSRPVWSGRSCPTIRQPGDRFSSLARNLSPLAKDFVSCWLRTSSAPSFFRIPGSPFITQTNRPSAPVVFDFPFIGTRIPKPAILIFLDSSIGVPQGEKNTEIYLLKGSNPLACLQDASPTAWVLWRSQRSVLAVIVILTSCASERACIFSMTRDL